MNGIKLQIINPKLRYYSLSYVKDYVGVKNLVIGFQNLEQLSIIMFLINKKFDNFNFLKKINSK